MVNGGSEESPFRHLDRLVSPVCAREVHATGNSSKGTGFSDTPMSRACSKNADFAIDVPDHFSSIFLHVKTRVLDSEKDQNTGITIPDGGLICKSSSIFWFEQWQAKKRKEFPEHLERDRRPICNLGLQGLTVNIEVRILDDQGVTIHKYHCVIGIDLGHFQKTQFIGLGMKIGKSRDGPYEPPPPP
jgi:hypothetical protein